MGFPLLDPPQAAVDALRQHGFVEDFNKYVTADLWTLVTDNGAAVIKDAAGGILKLTVTAVDNDESYLHTTKKLFTVVAGKPIYLEAILQFTEIATDDANVFFGLSSAAVANTLIDDDVGPVLNFSGAGFYKVGGELLWHVINSVTTTRKDTELTLANSLDGEAHTAGSASAFQRLGILLLPTSATKMDVTFSINGKVVCKHKDQIWTSFAACHVIFGNKSSGGIETLNVDLITAHQLRVLA